MSTKRRCFDASSFHCGQGAGRYSDALKKIAAATRTVNGTMSADENFFWEGDRNGRKGAPDAGTVENLQGEKRDRQQKAGGGDQRVRGKLSPSTGRYGGVNPALKEKKQEGQPEPGADGGGGETV